MLGKIFIVSVLYASSAPSASGEADDILRRGLNEFKYGNYSEAVTLLKGLLYPMRLYSDAQVIESRKYLGMAYFLLEDLEPAKLEFRKLLYLDPDHQLDPFTVAPPLIELFESVRQKHRDALEVIRSDKPVEATPPEPPPDFPMRLRTEKSEFAMFVPFGVGQFQNGDIGWGIAFLVAEVLLLAVNISSYIWLRGHELNGRPAYAEADASAIQAVTILQYASAGALGVVWSMGVMHARLQFLPFSDTTLPTPEDSSATPNGLSIGLGLELEF